MNVVLGVNGGYYFGGFLGFLYLCFVIYCAVVTLKKGHILLFFLGFLCGFAWIIGLFAEDRSRIQ